MPQPPRARLLLTGCQDSDQKRKLMWSTYTHTHTHCAAATNIFFFLPLPYLSFFLFFLFFLPRSVVPGSMVNGFDPDGWLSIIANPLWRVPAAGTGAAGRRGWASILFCLKSAQRCSAMAILLGGFPVSLRTRGAERAGSPRPSILRGRASAACVIETIGAPGSVCQRVSGPGWQTDEMAPTPLGSRRVGVRSWAVGAGPRLSVGGSWGGLIQKARRATRVWLRATSPPRS